VTIDKSIFDKRQFRCCFDRPIDSFGVDFFDDGSRMSLTWVPPDNSFRLDISRRSQKNGRLISVGHCRYSQRTRFIKKLQCGIDIERPTLPVANSPPGDLFPAYDEHPGPSVDDYIIDPDYPEEAYFYEIAP